MRSEGGIVLSNARLCGLFICQHHNTWTVWDIIMKWEQDSQKLERIPDVCVTCKIQVVDANQRHVFVMPAVVNTPSTMLTLVQCTFITTTVDIVHPNLTSCRTEMIPFNGHTVFPDS